MELINTGVIVTGAASGMGRATARQLAAQGAKVVLLDVNGVACAQVARDMGGIPITCDVSQGASVAEALAEATRLVPEIRALVNCAGVGRMQRIIAEDSDAQFAAMVETIQINLIGTIDVTRRVANHMARLTPTASGERGAIIHVASGAAFEGPEFSTGYTAAKGGIVSLTIAMARELGDHGIRVNTISPGAIDTAMLAGAPEQMRAAIASTTPFPKRMGTPDEFASLVLHVLGNVFLNGCVLRLDGGHRMPYVTQQPG